MIDRDIIALPYGNNFTRGAAVEKTLWCNSSYICFRIQSTLRLGRIHLPSTHQQFCHTELLIQIPPRELQVRARLRLHHISISIYLLLQPAHPPLTLPNLLRCKYQEKPLQNLHLGALISSAKMMRGVHALQAHMANMSRVREVFCISAKKS